MNSIVISSIQRVNGQLPTEWQRPPEMNQVRNIQMTFSFLGNHYTEHTLQIFAQRGQVVCISETLQTRFFSGVRHFSNAFQAFREQCQTPQIRGGEEPLPLARTTTMGLRRVTPLGGRLGGGAQAGDQGDFFANLRAAFGNNQGGIYLDAEGAKENAKERT